MGWSGPREMAVYIPKVNDLTGEVNEFRQNKVNSSYIINKTT